MAQPIPLTIAPRNPREELRARLERVPEQYADALIAACDMLQELHRRGVLDAARSAVAAGDAILSTAVGDLHSPAATKSVRNILALGSLLGAVDPESIRLAIAAVPDGLARASATSDDDASLLTLLRRLRSRNSRRGLAACVSLLESLGRHLEALERSRDDGLPSEAWRRSVETASAEG